MSDKELVKLAIQAKEKSYSPYSGFRVGAALLCKSGKVYTGCNIENSAYSPSVCAERTALFKAVSDGEKEFVKIAINSDALELTPPCGVCRQVMHEFADELEVIVSNRQGEHKTYKLTKLLPNAFKL